MVAACLDLVGSVAEPPYIVILHKAERHGQNHRGIAQQVKFSSRVTTLLVELLLQSRAYVGET